MTACRVSRCSCVTHSHVIHAAYVESFYAQMLSGHCPTLTPPTLYVYLHLVPPMGDELPRLLRTAGRQRVSQSVTFCRVVRLFAGRLSAETVLPLNV